MAVYARFGIEYKTNRFYIDGEFIEENCVYSDGRISDHLLQNNAFREIIDWHASELANLGFTQFIGIVCGEDSITVYYDSPYSSYLRGDIIVRDRGSIAGVDINGIILTVSDFIRLHPKYMNLLAFMERYRAEMIMNIRAILPQPIAEEIDVEYVAI